MSLKSCKITDKNVAELEILIDRKDFDAAVMQAYKKNVGKINVPGFRKGKAPKGMIEKIYGKTVFYDDAFDAILPSMYEDAVKESGLDIVSRPEIDLVSDDEAGVVISAKVYTKPEVELGNYKGYKIEKDIIKVEDEEIDAEINAVRNRNSRMITVEDRALAEGDTAKFDFEGFVDGVAFEGGKAEDYTLKIGSGQFIPGFEEKMIGHNVGEQFDIDVNFPEDYHAEELKGKAAVFKINLKGITLNELPEVDDEFVKDVSEFNTVEEYKADIKAKITSRKEKAADAHIEEKLQDELLNNLTVDVPVCMIQEEVDHYVSEYDSRLQMQGGNVQMYLQYMGMTMEQLKENFTPRAEKAVKIRLALEKIIEIENITVTEEQFENEYKTIAESYNIDIETVKSSLAKEIIEKDIKLRNAVEFIKDSAEIIEKAE